MSDSADFKWFTPSEHGDQVPDALLTNRAMNRIDMALMGATALAIIWNLFDVRGATSDGGMPSLAAANDFFLRPSTIVLWSVVIIAVTWLVVRYILTRETRFALIGQGLLLAFAALVPLLSAEMAGLGVLGPNTEMRLTAYQCEGAPPAEGNPNLSRCVGFPMVNGSIQMVGVNPASTDTAIRAPDEIAANTARWGGLPAGEYAIYLRVDTPDAVCTSNWSPVVAIDADPEISCLDSGSTVVRLEHPDDTRNLRLAVYVNTAE